MKNMVRKICVVTGSRAEYGLLYWLLKDMQADPDLELQLVVTGMHLSPEFGSTWQHIVADGFSIVRKVEMLLSSDTPVGISKAMGLGLIGFADALDQLRPDLLVVLGDRFEIFAAAQAAMNQRIPIAHIHGGELTEGLVDDAIRHSLTKMSHLHFVATAAYQRRVIQLGEQADRVFNVGALGVDCVKKLKLLNKSAIEKAIGFNLADRNLLITFHPVTLEDNTSETQFLSLLSALDELDNTHLFFTKPNADAGGRVICELIDEYVYKHSEKAISFISLGSLRYLSLAKYMSGVVGNSSSGLIEIPALNVGTLNIGDRQNGRVKSDSVIDCEACFQSIKIGLNKLLSDEFNCIIKNVKNPYGGGNASERIFGIIKSFYLGGLVKKTFFDMG